MTATFRRPGVYLEETLLTGPNDVGSADSASVFVGAASRGQLSGPVRCDSWTEYLSHFGDFTPAPGAQVGYLPYAVHSYFQNGGRVAYVQRATSSTTGSAATFTIVGEDPDDEAANAFVVTASSTGEWGNALRVGIDVQQVGDASSAVFTLSVYRADSVNNLNLLEQFSNLSVTGMVPGTKRADLQVNDSVYGSAFIRIGSVNTTVIPNEVAPNTAPLSGGVDGGLPSTSDLQAAAGVAVGAIEGPILLNIVGHQLANGSHVLTSVSPSTFDRGDVFVINDAAEPRPAGQLGSAYADALIGQPLTSIGTGSSYVASYSPWIVIQNPAVTGGTITIPPGGAVAGVYSRTDATRGIFFTPAGINAGVASAIDVDARFSTSKQGELNSRNINVIRPIPNSGITVMGGRTRKTFGVDRYVAPRRTLIYIKESLRVSTQFAVFENNSQLLWSRLRATADNILRPIWSAGGLRGSNAAEAYFIVCDESVNTPQVIAAGEVRMNVGVALEYPAEFITIQVSQFDGGASAAEILTAT